MDPMTQQRRERLANVAAIVVTFALFLAAIAILASEARA